MNQLKQNKIRAVLACTAHEIFKTRCFKYYAHGGRVENSLLYANSSNSR